MAVERYTQGPVVQTIQQLDNERSMIITQTVNPRSKKREVLVRYFVENKEPSKPSQNPEVRQFNLPPDVVI